MKTVTRWLCVGGALLMFGNAQAAVRAWVDSNQIAPGDTVQLNIEHDGQTNDQPDLGPLKQDFDILSTSRSSNVQIINGNMSSKVQLQLMLSPKHGGAVTIPAITWGSDHSDPINIQVSASAGSNQSASGGGNGRPVFLQTTVDQSQPYVQAAVKVTVRIYIATALYQAGLDLPGNNDVLVQQIGKDQNSTVVKNGKRYQVIQRQYMLFPQRSGKLKVPGAVLSGQIAVRNAGDPFGNDDAFDDIFGKSPFNGMMTSTKPIQLHGDDIVLNVQPRPAQANGSYWLPAKKVDVTAQWHPDQLQAKVGDPVTLDLHMQATGLTAAQLPDLSSLLKLPAGIKAYPDQAKLNNNTQGEDIVGTRDQSIALIADQPGQFNIPALHVQWWDTQAKQMREVTVPARTLSITGTASTNNSQAAQNTTPVGSSAQPANPVSSPSNNTPSVTRGMNDKHWQWLAIGLALLWLITLGVWWFVWRIKKSRLQQPEQKAAPKAQAVNVSASRAREEFLRACKQNDAASARRNLLAWIGAEWHETPAGLRAFATKVNNEELSALLLELDRACYLGEHWNGTKLMTALNKLPSRSTTSKKDKEKELASLYH